MCLGISGLMVEVHDPVRGLELLTGLGEAQAEIDAMRASA